MPSGTLSAVETEGYKRSAAHLDQGLGHTIRELASHISYLTTLCDQLANSDFGDTAQGRRLIAGSVSRQTISLCHTLQGAQFFRAKGAKLFAGGRRGERSIRQVQRELGYTPTPARQSATAHPRSGGLHLPRAPLGRKSLRTLPPKNQHRKLVAVPDPERHFVHPPHVEDLEGVVTYLQVPPELQPFSAQHAKALEDAKVAADFSLARDLLIQEEPTSDVTDDEAAGYHVLGLDDRPEDAEARGTPFSRTHPFPSVRNHPAKRRRSTASAGASSSTANAPLPAPSSATAGEASSSAANAPLPATLTLAPAVPAAASAPATLTAQPQPQLLSPEQSPTWLLERPANAARRRRLNRSGCQRPLGLPCACVACTAPILHAAGQSQPAPTLAPEAAPEPLPPAQPQVVYTSQPPQLHTLPEAASPPTSPPAPESCLGPASEDSYDPGLLPSDSDLLPALALTHLLHCPERGTTCPCPHCQDRLAAALWDGTNPSPSRHPSP